MKGLYRTAITVPEKSWGRLRDIIDDFCEKLENNSEVIVAACYRSWARDDTAATT